MRKRTYLRLRVAAFFAAIGLGGAGAFAAALWFAWSRAGGPTEGYVTAGLIGGFVLIGLTAWVGFLFDENVARPIMGLSRELRARAATDVDAKIDQTPGRYLGHLAPAADAIHDALMEARRKRDEAVAAETARIARDKAFLATLVRDLSQAVLVISPEHRIMLFNDAASRLFGGLSLDRPLERFLTTAPLARHLSPGLTEQDAGASAHFLTTALRDNTLISGSVSAFSAEDALLGYVIVCEPATDRICAETDADRRMSALLENVRRPAMNLGAMLDVIDLADPKDDDVQQIHGRMRSELHNLAGAVGQTSLEVDSLAHRAWPRDQISADALFDRAGIPALLAPEHALDAVVVHCDVFFVTSLLTRLTATIDSHADRGGAQWRIEPIAETRVQFCLQWNGQPMTRAELDHFLDQHLAEPYARFSCREVIAALDLAIWLTGSCGLRLELPRLGASVETQSPALRPPLHFFDFPTRSAARDQLVDLPFVVFDTETTGLDSAKDDVVQIAGVRILRSEILVGDEFDALVNPGRRIPPSSTDIHGITDAMVAEAPPFTEVARDFAEYVDDTILVAHNAQFDVGFLKRVTAGGGPAFTSPILCTALLSQALDPQINDHTLDALAVRYGIEIDEANRHTALGDAYTTAGVFQKMLPILQARDVATLAGALSFQNGGAQPKS